MKQHLKRMAIIFSLLSLTTAASAGFRVVGLHESNIILSYLLSALIVSYLIEGYFYSMLTSVLGLFAYNYFFIYPIYSFQTYRNDYPVTILFMLLATGITSTLTTKVIRNARVAKKIERQTALLYQLSQKLLRAGNQEMIARVVGEDVSHILNVKSVIALADFTGVFNAPICFKHGEMINQGTPLPEHHLTGIQQVFNQMEPKTCERQFPDDTTFYYVPIIGQGGCLGVFGTELEVKENLSDEKIEFLAAITSQMAMAIEREHHSEEQREASFSFERERLRSNLLRAISHDLRTPLTGILGATGTLIDNREVIAEEAITSLLNDINEDAQWLIHSVENILSMTQFEEGSIEIHKKPELIEEIVVEAINHMKKTTVHHTIELVLPPEVVLVPMDGQLIEKVIINLLDNAVKYTPVGSKIEIDVNCTTTHLLVRVADNGKGIPEAAFPLLFNRFYTVNETSDRGQRGIGIGLEICKSIVEAHNGTIRAYNNHFGGATFEFTLPLGRD